MRVRLDRVPRGNAACGTLPHHDLDLTSRTAILPPLLTNANMSGHATHDSAAHPAEQHHPQDAIGAATKALLMTGGAGLFISAIQNSLQRENVGALGVFTRTGGTIATFGMDSWVYRAIN